MTDTEIRGLAQDVLSLAQERGVMIATAESCTGGMVGTALTAIPGSSTVYERGFVTYSNAAKMQMLGVAQATLETHGAVSEPVAAEMALGARHYSAAQLTVSITGIAGPGGSEHKPEGRVCFGFGMEEIATETVDFGALGRDEVRREATAHALRMLRAALVI